MGSFARALKLAGQGGVAGKAAEIMEEQAGHRPGQGISEKSGPIATIPTRSWDYEWHPKSCEAWIRIGAIRGMLRGLAPDETRKSAPLMYRKREAAELPGSSSCRCAALGAHENGWLHA